MSIIGMAPYSIVVTIVPLVFILSVTAIKEAYEDFLRHQEDRKTNSAKYYHLTDKNYEEYTSGEIEVGDIIKIQNNESVPADCVLLYSSESDDKIFIDTANLDGETK